MKRALLALILILIPNAAHADSLPDHFIITGSGFGHGVGLSQVGIVDRRGLDKPFGCQRVHHALRIVDVHLTAI